MRKRRQQLNTRLGGEREGVRCVCVCVSRRLVCGPTGGGHSQTSSRRTAAQVGRLRKEWLAVPPPAGGQSCLDVGRLTGGGMVGSIPCKLLDRSDREGKIETERGSSNSQSQRVVFSLCSGEEGGEGWSLPMTPNGGSGG